VRKQHKSMMVLPVKVALIATVLFLPGLIGAGELEPSGPPGPTMKTLQDIYDKLDAIARDIFEIKTGCQSHWRFCDMGDGTVLDISTGLIWLKNANCFGQANVWNNAMSAAATLADGQCGLTDGSQPGDWRLPTKEEWEAFVDINYSDPALCNAAGNGQWSAGDAFDHVLPVTYWSGTSAWWINGYAWYMDMGDGVVGYWTKQGQNFVWPVRAGN